MTTLLIILGVWGVLSVPLALLVARLVRCSDDDDGVQR